MPIAATERTLRAILQYGIDPRGLREVQTGTEDLEALLVKLRKSVVATGMATDGLGEVFKDLGEKLERVSSTDAPLLKAELEKVWAGFKSGEIPIEQVRDSLDKLQIRFKAVTVFGDLEKELNRLRQQAAFLSEEWQDLGGIASQYEALGMEFADMGRSVTDSMRGWADQYVQVAGEADEISQMWLQTTKELETQQARLGGVAIKALVPLIDATAGVVDKAADLAEKYPEAMQIALVMGAAVVAAAALQSAVTRGIRMYADAKLLAIETQRFLSARLMRDAANKQLAAATMMGAASKERALLGMGGAAGKLGGIGGVLSAAAPVLAVGAAAAAVTAVGKTIVDFVGNTASKSTEMANHWDVFLTKAVGETENATDLASQYNDAQKRVNDAFNKGGILAEAQFNRQEMVNASQDKVQQSLIRVAKSYDDYERAIDSLNDNLGKSEDSFYKLSQEAFDHRRVMDGLWQSYREGNATLRDLANATSGFEGLVLRLQAGVSDMVGAIKLLEPWNEFQDALEQATEDHTKEIEKLEGENKKELVKLDIETADERKKIENAYKRAVVQLDVDTATERKKIVEREKEAVLKAESDIEDERSKTMSSFQSDLAEMEADYYASRAEAAADYGLDVARAEQDHQKEIRRMQEDSADRQRSAIRSRDALALLEEVRSYQRDRGRAEEDYRIEAARRSEDFARQLAEMEANFQKQQQERQRAYQEELATLQERLDDEKQMLADQAEKEGEILENSRANQVRDLYEQKTGEEDTLNESYERQTNDLASNLRDQQIVANNAYDEAVAAAESRWESERQLRGIYLPGELAELDAHYQARLVSLQAFMDQANLIVRPRGGSYPERQSGGYSAGRGLHMLGERGREFVMDAATTRRAETIAGGNLTQDRLLAAMAGGGRALPPINMSFNFGSVSDPARIMTLVRKGTLETMEQVLRKLQ